MDFSNVSLNDCVATMEGPETAHLKIICTLSETTVLNLPSISKLSQSLLFKQMYWKPQCRTKLNQLQQAEEHNELLKIDTLIKKIFLPAKEEWQKLCQQIKDGTVTFQILDKLLEICGKNMEQIESEINLMAEKSGEKWQKKRITQIAEYTKLKNYEKGAKILNETRLTLGLEGDFDGLELLCASVSFRL